MTQLYLFTKWLAKFFQWWGICATVGFLAGAISGVILLLVFSVHGTVITLTYGDTWRVALLLAAFCFIALLWILYVLCRLTLASIFLSTLINCILTCFFTVYLVNKLAAWKWAVFIGMLVGLFIGYLLCLLCRYLGLGGKDNGLYRA